MRTYATAAERLGVAQDTFLEFGRHYACFAGDGSPLTQAGGLTGQTSEDDMAELDRFFGDRTDRWEAVIGLEHGAETVQWLLDSGGSFEQYELVMTLAPRNRRTEKRPAPEITICRVKGSAEEWGQVATEAFFGHETSKQMPIRRILENSPDTRRYIGYWNGTPAAAALTVETEHGAMLGGMATLPAFRRRGLQLAMLEHRLADIAPDHRLAVLESVPGTASHRNALRLGFTPANLQVSVSVPMETH